MNVAVFLPNWIGDAVMCTPALRALRTGLPEAEIVAVLRPPIGDVLAGLDLVDRALVLPAPRLVPDRRTWSALRELRRARFDLAVLFTNSLRSAVVARLAGAKRRTGYDRDGRGWLLTDRIPCPDRKTPAPVLEAYNRLAAHVGCTQLSRTTELAVLPEDAALFERFRAVQAPVLRDAPFVCLNPGGAFGSAKHWPTEHFAELARRIVSDFDRSVLVLCGPAERAQAAEIVERTGNPRIVSLATCEPSLGLTKAAISAADLLVTTDSGPRHFAQPLGTPVVTLFGPTHVAWSETWHPRSVHVQIPVDCGPCQKRTCPLGHHKCLRDLTPDRVLSAVADLLAAPVQSGRATGIAGLPRTARRVA